MTKSKSILNLERQTMAGGQAQAQVVDSLGSQSISKQQISEQTTSKQQQTKENSIPHPHQALFDSIPQTGLKCDILFLTIKNRIQEEPEYVKRLRVVLQFNITKNGEPAATWTCDTKTTIEGDIYRDLPKPGLKADCILTVDDDDWVKIMVGKLNPQRAFMMSKFKIKGNIMLLQKLHALWFELRRKGKTPELDLIQEIMVNEPLLAGLKSEAMAIEIVQRIVKMPHLVDQINATIQINILKQGNLMAKYLIGMHPGKKPEFRRLYSGLSTSSPTSAQQSGKLITHKQLQQTNNNNIEIRPDVLFSIEDDDLVLIIYGIYKVDQAIEMGRLKVTEARNFGSSSSISLEKISISDEESASELAANSNLSDNKQSNIQRSLYPPKRLLPADTILLENGSTTFVSTLEEFLDSSSTSSSSNRDELNSATTESSGVQGASERNKSNSLSLEEQAAKIRKLELPELERGSHETISGSTLTEQHVAHPSSGSNATTPTSTTSNEHSATHATSTPSAIAPHAEASTGAEGNHHQHNNNNHHHNHHAGHAPPTNSTGPKPIPQHWQVRSLLNVTHDYPLAYSQIICGYIWPLMAAITLFTNLMIVFVLIQRDMRTPTNVVLTAIAIADIIPIVVPVPWFIYLFAMENEKQVLYPPLVCYFYQHSTRSVSEVFYFLSTWLNVLLAVHDYLTACWPKLAKKYCQIKVVVIEIISLTLLAFLLNLPQALKLVFKPIKFIYEGKITFGCKALQAKWFKELIGEYVALYDDIFTAIIVLFVDGGPAIALIALTALLIRQLRRQRIKGHLLMEQARTASKRRRERHRQQEYESSARVMIFVLLAFLAVKIPFATTYTLMIIQSRFEIHFVENLNDFQKAVSIIDLVFVLSYPLNFTIFCCCSKKFRHKCVQLLGECNSNTKDARNRLMSRVSDSFISNDTDMNSRKNSIATIDLQQAAKNHQHYHLDGSNGNLIKVASNSDFHQTMKELSAQLNEKICSNRPYHHGGDDAERPLVDGVFNSPEFKAKLEDGSLCYECIMRYERMKKRLSSACSSILSTTRRRISADSTNWPAPPPVPTPPLPYQLPSIVTTACDSIQEQSVDRDDEVSSSDSLSSSSENITNTKVIVQTSVERNEEEDNNDFEEARTCQKSHYHRERSSDIEGGDEEEELEEEGVTADLKHVKQQQQQDRRRRRGQASRRLLESEPASYCTSRRSISQRRHSDRAGGNIGGNVVARVGGSEGKLDNPNRNRPRRESDNQNYREQNIDTNRLSRPYYNQSQQQQQVMSDGGGAPGGSDDRKRRDSKQPPVFESLRRGTSSNRGCSDPGGGKFFRQLKIFIRRSDVGLDTGDSSCSRLDRGDDKTTSSGQGRGEHDLSLMQMENKHRSLSMSNSKLSALPSATCLLADILKTTLLTSEPSPASGPSTSGAKNAANLAPKHKRLSHH